MDSDLDEAYFKQKLIDLKEALQQQQEAESGGDTVELDQSRVGRLSRMDALQNQAMSQETQRRRSLELIRIQSALKRIDEGEFGYCVTCGNEIAAARLEIDPAATQCLVCAESAEQQ